MNKEERYLRRITCPGRTGLVAAITGFLANQNCFITELSQFDHTFGLDQLLATGRNAENYAFSRVVEAHSEHRVFLNGHKTVVLK
jgi:formyltetrahydrofolate hydrolase